MRLSDVMSHSGLSGYAEIALLLFLAAFLAIVVHTFRRDRRSELEAMARMPLEDDAEGARPSRTEPGAPAHGGPRS